MTSLRVFSKKKDVFLSFLPTTTGEEGGRQGKEKEGKPYESRPPSPSLLPEPLQPTGLAHPSRRQRQSLVGIRLKALNKQD